MNAYFKEVFSDKIIFFGFLFAVVLCIATVGYTLLLYTSLPPLIPLFNQMPWGLQRLGAKQEIFLPLLFTIIIVIVNVFFAIFLYKQMPLIARILCTTSLLVCLFTLLLTVRTIQLII